MTIKICRHQVVQHVHNSSQDRYYDCRFTCSVVTLKTQTTVKYVPQSAFDSNKRSKDRAVVEARFVEVTAVEVTAVEVTALDAENPFGRGACCVDLSL